MMPQLLMVQQLEQFANWCRECSVTGRAHGEPGELCTNCGGPLRPTDEELAETRTMRNAQIGRGGQENRLPELPSNFFSGSVRSSQGEP